MHYYWLVAVLCKIGHSVMNPLIKKSISINPSLNRFQTGIDDLDDELEKTCHVISRICCGWSRVHSASVLSLFTEF